MCFWICLPGPVSACTQCFTFNCLDLMLGKLLQVAVFLDCNKSLKIFCHFAVSVTVLFRAVVVSVNIR